ncbi:MAG: UDP-N-acetylmuramate dehydrogenase [Balneolales bacterium]|nr:UDP-N-acetylmuramate dehydrogenase [Balneolales bacterium]
MNLTSLNTFGAEAEALHFFELYKAETYAELLKTHPQLMQDALIIGGGSNILFTNSEVSSVLKVSIPGITITETESDEVLVTAGAGVVWDELVQYCLSQNLCGIENLSLIPGCCGAAPMQNIGAYGVELVDVFEQLEAIDRSTGKISVFGKDACRFGYRTSVFKEELRDRFLIASITLRLSRVPHLNLAYGAIGTELTAMGISDPTPQDVAQAVIRIRQSKLPDWRKFGNAGSFFKNPVIPDAQFTEILSRYPNVPHYPAGRGFTKVPAGWLIEQCGLKGVREGRVGTWPKQALVIVNYEAGDGRQILAFARRVRDAVLDKFGIRLEPEVNLIGMKQADF